MTPRRRLAACLVAVLGAGSVLTAAPAVAAPTPVNVPFRCSVALFDSSYQAAAVQTIPITLDAPATVEAGSDIDVTYTLTGATPQNAPFAIEDVVTRLRPSLTAQPAGLSTPVNVGEGTGAESAATDVSPYEQFAAPSPVTVSVPTTGLGPADVAGTAELRVDVLRIDLVSGADGVGDSDTDVVTCTPDPVQAVFAAVVITPAPGTEIPVGAVGGLGLAALLGLVGLGALMTQNRRRHA